MRFKNNSCSRMLYKGYRPKTLMDTANAKVPAPSLRAKRGNLCLRLANMDRSALLAMTKNGTFAISHSLMAGLLTQCFQVALDGAGGLVEQAGDFLGRQPGFLCQKRQNLIHYTDIDHRLRRHINVLVERIGQGIVPHCCRCVCARMIWRCSAKASA